MSTGLTAITGSSMPRARNSSSCCRQVSKRPEYTDLFNQFVGDDGGHRPRRPPAFPAMDLI